MAPNSKRWPPDLSNGNNTVTDGDADKRKQLWEHCSKQTSDLDKLRSTTTDDQIIAILSNQAKTCAGKVERRNAKAMTKASAKPPAKASAKLTSFTGKNFTSATALEGRCLVYKDGKTAPIISPEELGDVPGIALVSKAYSYKMMSNMLDNGIRYHDEDTALLVAGILAHIFNNRRWHSISLLSRSASVPSHVFGNRRASHLICSKIDEHPI